MKEEKNDSSIAKHVKANTDCLPAMEAQLVKPLLCTGASQEPRPPGYFGGGFHPETCTCTMSTEELESTAFNIGNTWNFTPETKEHLI